MARTWTARRYGMEHLQRHVAAGGSTRIPPSYRDTDGFALGQFIANQRVQYRAGKMPIERVRELETIPDWVWHIGYDDFKRKIQRIEAYAEPMAPAGYLKDSAIETASGSAVTSWACEDAIAWVD